MSDELELTIEELRGRYRRGRSTPIDVVEAALERIERHNSRLQAIAQVRRDAARREARAAQRRIADGNPIGPLDGVPVVIKSMIAVQGMTQDAGSTVLADHVATRDASLVARLRAAGAIVVASSTMDEFALTTLGPARNPYDPTKTAGGSSGGSAVAVQDGMCFAAIGTDTGGSIRIPAAFCAVVGLKPTYGLIPTDGIIPLAWSLDHAGPIGRTVQDVAEVFDVLVSGTRAPGPARAVDPTTLTVAVPSQEWLAVVDPDLRLEFAATRQAWESAGARTIEVDVPTAAEVRSVHWPVLSAEMAAYHRQRFGAEESRYGPAMRNGIAAGADISSEEYLSAQRGRTILRHRVDELLSSADVLALPTTAVSPTALGKTRTLLAGEDEDAVTAMVCLTALANHTGHPALSVRPGTAPERAPAGVQLVARHYDEHRLLEIGALVQDLR